MLHTFDKARNPGVLSWKRALPLLVCEQAPGNLQAKDLPFTLCAGKLPYDNIPSDHNYYNVTLFDIDVSSALPEERVLHVRGNCQPLSLQCTSVSIR